MGYAIVGGSGLALGLGLMIWALVERGRRNKAALEAKDAVVRQEEYRRIADGNRERVVELERQIGKVDLELAAVRGKLTEARDRLAKCNDPQTIKDWLDRELEGGEV